MVPPLGSSGCQVFFLVLTEDTRYIIYQDWMLALSHVRTSCSLFWHTTACCLCIQNLPCGDGI